ncbi:MAG: cysteine hydrolase family protein [Cuniculiplasma sp.]
MKETAVLAIDLQNAIMEGPIHNREVFTDNVKGILETARKINYPVFMVQHAEKKGSDLEPGTEGWKIYSQFLSKDSEPVIHKEYPDSFYKTDLDMILKSEGIKSLVLCGLMTEYCVDTTVRSAFAHGYKILLAGDGHSTFNRENIGAEQMISLVNSITSEWFGEVKDSKNIMKLLDDKKFD